LKDRIKEISYGSAGIHSVLLDVSDMDQKHIDVLINYLTNGMEWEKFLEAKLD